MIFVIIKMAFFVAFFGRTQPGYQNIEKNTPSITTYAMDNFRSGFIQQQESLIFNPSSSRPKIDSPLLTDATSAMPLFINGFKSPWSNLNQFQNKHILIFGTKNKGLRFLILNSMSLLWDIQLPGNTNSSPVIDEKTQILYGLAVDYSPGRHTPIYNYLYSIDLRTGEMIHSLQVDRNLFLKHSEANKNTNCKTALGLEHYGQRDFIFFGCSIYLQNATDTNPPLYAGSPGLTGLVYRIEVQKGRFQNSAAIKTSQFYKNELPSGADTGVYLAGGAIASDGKSLYVATGNGPNLFKNNWGCSIIRVPLAHFTEKSVSGLTANPSPDPECYALNLDLSSGAVSIAPFNNKVFGANTGKDGVLRIFKAESNQLNWAFSEKISSRLHFGQPIVLSDKNSKSLEVFSHYSRDDIALDMRLAPLSEDRNLRQSGFKQHHCIGKISKKNGDVPAGIYYSGPYRDSILLAPSDKMNKKMMTNESRSHLIPGSDTEWATKDFWSPYVFKRNIGSFSTDPNHVQLSFYWLLLDQGTKLMFLPTKDFNFSDFFLAEEVIKLKERGNIDLTNQVLKSKDMPIYLWNCSDKAKHLVPLYLYTRVEVGESFSGIKAFKMTEEKIDTLWKNIFPDNVKPLRGNLLVASWSNTKLIFIPATDQKQNVLYAFDAKTGKLFKKYPMSGASHFTMPIVIGNYVIIATEVNGINIFEI